MDAAVFSSYYRKTSRARVGLVDGRRRAGEGCVEDHGECDVVLLNMGEHVDNEDVPRSAVGCNWCKFCYSSKPLPRSLTRSSKVREKPTIVSTGPYGLVRHPLYSYVPAYVVLSLHYIPIADHSVL